MAHHMTKKKKNSFTQRLLQHKPKADAFTALEGRRVEVDLRTVAEAYWLAMGQGWTSKDPSDPVMLVLQEIGAVKPSFMRTLGDSKP